MKSDSTLPKTLPPSLRSLLRRFDWTQRSLAMIERLAFGILATGGVVFLACLFDRVVDLDGFWRLPFPWLALGLGTATLLGAAAVLLHRRNDDALAHRLDRLRGDRRDQLRSMVDFAGRADGGGPLGRVSQAAALAFWQDARPGTLAPRRRALQSSLAALGLLALMGLAALQPWARAALLWQRFMDPTGNYPRPTATWFEIAAPTTLNGGDDFILVARLAGRPVQAARPLARIHSGDQAPILRPLLEQEDGGWRLALTELHAPFTCVLVMGKVRSEAHHVAVIPRPAIAKVEVTYDYPKYSGLKSETKILAGRTLTALEGTKARIVVTANLPLATFDARSGEDRIAFRVDSGQPEQATRFHYISRNERLDVLLTARNGLESKGELPFNIRAIADAPPTVQLTGKDLDRAFFAHEIVTIPFQAQDDLGLAEVAIRAFPGDYQQEAELVQYGATRIEGDFRVPVSSLVRPGLREAKLRLQAIDLKGQSVMSQAVTIRIAINSYDRQLRTARNSLQGMYSSRELSASGFPNLAYHGNDRLTAVRTLHSRLLILGESLSEGEKVAESQLMDVQTIQALIQQLEPRPRYLLPSIGERPDDVIPSLTFLADQAMTPRLGRLLAETTCGGDLAIPGEALRRQFDVALAGPNPKAELTTLRATVAQYVTRQEDLAQRLQRAREFIDLELAGILAASLSRDLATADAARWADHDFLIASRRKLNELAALLKGHQAGLPDLPQPADEALSMAVANADEASLRALAEPLATIDSFLASAAAAWALRESEWRLPLDEYGQGAAPQEKWLDVAALALLMEMNDEGRDEIAYSWQVAQQLDRRGSRAHAWPGISKQADRNLQLVTLANRIARLAEELRVGLLAGEFAPADPAAEALWILLRERRFDLLRLLAAEAQGSALGGAAAPLTAGGELLTRWTIPAEPPAATADRLAGWAAAARQLAELGRAPAREAISMAARCLAERWESLLLAGIQSYRRDIAARMQEIQQVPHPEEPYAIQNAVFGPLPQMFGRLKTMQIFVSQCLSLAILERVETGKCSFPEERLMALAQLLRQAEKDLFGEVGSPIANVAAGLVRDESTMAVAAQKGKVATYQSLDELIAVIEGLVQAGAPAEAAQQELARRHLVHLYGSDRDALRMALAQTEPLSAARLAALKSDREGAALLWQTFLAPLAKLGEELARNPAGAGGPWNPLGNGLVMLGELPKGADGLRDLLRQLATEPAALGNGELLPMLERLRELARPPEIQSDAEVLTRRRRTILREQIGLAFGMPGSSAAAVQWAVVELEWSRRKAAAAEKNVGIAGLAVGGDDDLSALKLPRHLYLELKRAREHAMPELFRERCAHYLNTILEKAR